MKKITLEVKPISEAPKNGNGIISWCGNTTVVIAWRKFTKSEWEQPDPKWYKLWMPEFGQYVEVEDEEQSGWWFGRYCPNELKWVWTAKCGLFVPTEWVPMPVKSMIVEAEQ